MLYNYICVEGNIGSGKTLLASMLAEFFDSKLILERFSNNPFLPKFYIKILMEILYSSGVREKQNFGLNH